MKEIKFEFVERVKQLSYFGTDGGWAYLPQKGSKKAAGYDFINPEEVTIQPNEIVYVKTGIKAQFPDDMALLLLNRSSNPKKKHLILANGIGLVDADYYNNPDNEGEIAFAFMNVSSEPVTILRGEKLGQGMFVRYYDVVDYDSDKVNDREGGFGSTGE